MQALCSIRNGVLSILKGLSCRRHMCDQKERKRILTHCPTGQDKRSPLPRQAHLQDALPSKSWRALCQSRAEAAEESPSISRE